MNRANGIYGFLMIYFAIFALSILGHLFLIAPSNLSTNTWMYATSFPTLTHLSATKLSPQYYSTFIFSMIITQLSGIVLLSMLLWFCWQLFGNQKEKSYSPTKALRYTSIVTLMCESVLFMFFTYSIPKELVNFSLQQKLWASASLAINSFNNAGITFSKYFFSEDVLSNNFMIQLGLIAGTILGSLGIFTIIDLFSPSRLRQRLDNPKIDWRFITKISFFGSAAIMILFMAIYHLFGNREILSDKNILETLSYVLLEGANARGFGFELSQGPLFGTEIVNATYSFFGAGPFSSGGGIGLLFFVFAYTLIKGKNDVSEQTKTAFSIVINWLYLSMICIGISLFVLAFTPDKMRFTEVLLFYNSNHISLISSEESFLKTVVTVFLNLTGRISLIIACMLTLNQIKHASRSF